METKIHLYKPGILVFGVMTSVFMLDGCTPQPTSPNNTIISPPSNTTAIPKRVPALNITLPLLANTTEKVSGWVPTGSEATLLIDGVHAGMRDLISTNKRGYFTDSIVIPDNPVNSVMTLELLSNGKVMIKQSFKVGNPYKP